MVSGEIVCIPSRFTVPRSSLVACMLPGEFRWEEVAPPHKGMTQLIVPELGSYTLNRPLYALARWYEIRG